MKTRSHWGEIKNPGCAQFKWCPTSDGINFDQLGKHGPNFLVNHFMNHGELSCKDNLVVNMKKACEKLKEDVLAYLPMTFIVDFNGLVKDN